jgi:hypothetical protein
MTALIAVYTGDGCVGRCDAKCYNAWGPECHCICQGGNHGAGKQEAIGNTRELAGSWLEHARAGGRDSTRAELAVTVIHEPLFELGSAR